METIFLIQNNVNMYVCVKFVSLHVVNKGPKAPTSWTGHLWLLDGQQKSFKVEFCISIIYEQLTNTSKLKMLRTLSPWALGVHMNQSKNTCIRVDWQCWQCIILKCDTSIKCILCIDSQILMTCIGFQCRALYIFVISTAILVEANERTFF